MKRVGILTTVLALFFAVGVGEVLTQTKKTTTRKKPVLKKNTTVKTTASTPTAPTVKLYTVDKGQVIRVRMNGSISSKTAKVGDLFTTTITEPVYSNGGIVVAPVGSTITGKVTAVTPAARKGKPGEIDVDFIDIKTPTGAKYAISGDLTELTSNSAKSDNEGTASGDKMKHRKVIFIGGGAGLGAIIGGIAGGGVGTAIGAGAGAGAGIIADQLLKGEEATVKQNTEFGVFLNKAVSLPKFVEIDN